jgi:hypothetical protein
MSQSPFRTMVAGATSVKNEDTPIAFASEG